MQTLIKLIKQANQSLRTADHLATITYPLIKDNKILITVAENLDKALSTAMYAMLYYDRLFKRIHHLPENFNSQLEIFKDYTCRKYNLDRQYIILITDMRKIVEHRKDSPIEFARKNKYIICSDNYNMKVITPEKMKEYLNQSKEFISQINEVLGKNVRRYTG